MQHMVKGFFGIFDSFFHAIYLPKIFFIDLKNILMQKTHFKSIKIGINGEKNFWQAEIFFVNI